LCALNFRSHDPWRDGPYNALGNLVLNNKDVFERTLVTLCPDVLSATRVDQLRGDANAIGRLSHAPFEHIANTELPPYLTHIDGLTFVGKRRVAGDDEQPMRLGQRRNDVFRDAIGKKLLLGITAHILECEDRDRGFFGKCKRGRLSIRHRWLDLRHGPGCSSQSDL
jgi:hypothetical protein